MGPTKFCGPHRRNLELGNSPPPREIDYPPSRSHLGATVLLGELIYVPRGLLHIVEQSFLEAGVARLVAAQRSNLQCSPACATPTPDGLSPRWTFPDGFPPDGIAPDGFPRDGFSPDGLPPDGLGGIP